MNFLKFVMSDDHSDVDAKREEFTVSHSDIVSAVS